MANLLENKKITSILKRSEELMVKNSTMLLRQLADIAMLSHQQRAALAISCAIRPIMTVEAFFQDKNFL